MCQWNSQIMECPSCFVLLWNAISKVKNSCSYFVTAFLVNAHILWQHFWSIYYPLVNLLPARPCSCHMFVLATNTPSISFLSTLTLWMHPSQLSILFPSRLLIALIVIALLANSTYTVLVALRYSLSPLLHYPSFRTVKS